MPKNRTVANEALRPNATVLVRGRVTFCRVRSQVAGDELAKANARAVQQGRQPRQRPYTTLSISNAEVIRSDPNAAMMTPEEIYVMESFFTSSKPEYPGMNYSAYNTGNYLPRICVREGTVVNELAPEQLEGELANGLQVTLVLRVFASNNAFNRHGISMDMVICDEPIRFFGGNANLSAYGLTMNLNANRQPVAPAAPAQTGYPAAPAQAYPAAPAAAPAVGYPAGYPAQPAAPAQAPTQTYPAAPAGYPAGYPAQPVAPAQAPAAPAGYPAGYPGAAAPQQNLPYNPGADQAPFGYPGQQAPAGAPQAAPNPYAGQDVGITYDPDAPERGY